jgi:IS1 family transposase
MGQIMSSMNKLDREARARILHLLCDGSSIRAVTRLTGASKNTVTKLLVDAGRAASAYQDETLRNLPCRRVQVDEIWSFCYAKQGNLPEEKRGQLACGALWTWTAICADTKLVPSWFVGRRDAEHAHVFISELSSRLANRVQLTSDGHKPYLDVIDDIMHQNVDYAMLVKIYGMPQEGTQHRYSPTECIRARRQAILVNADPDQIRTSYVERQNLTMRIHMRRFTRLTNAFSKKAENHIAAVSLHFLYYNFVRIHQKLRVTPAMAAGVVHRLWNVEEMVVVLEKYEQENSN